MNDPLLEIDQVDKIYGSAANPVHAVKGLSMSVNCGEIVSLLGSSGCGKTSTLRMIAGFETVSSGRINIAGRTINKLAPVKRGVAMAFEGYSLYPPLTVKDNIAFALKAAKLKRDEVSKRVADICKMLEITDILDKYPSSISAGQQQRVSLARALIRDAQLHLLDEPMGQLEPQLRALLRGRIKHFIKENGLTVILVTHDQAEANALSDRIAVMEDGFLQQFESPQMLKEQPANLFTGTFIGEPPMNVFEAKVIPGDQYLHFELEGGVHLSYSRSEIDTQVLEAAQSLQSVVLGVRPYAVRRSERGVKATVFANQWLGDQSHIAATLAGKTVVMVEHERSTNHRGDEISLAVDPAHLHLFDPQTGQAISHGKDLARELAREPAT